MSAGIVALLVAASTATWVFTRLQDRSGHGNSRDAGVGAVVFVLIFLVVFTLGHMILR